MGRPEGDGTDAGRPPATVSTDPPGSDQQFRLLVDAVTDYAIFMLDPSGHVTTWNQGAARPARRPQDPARVGLSDVGAIGRARLDRRVRVLSKPYRWAELSERLRALRAPG
jgi:hypothetical protein